MSQTIEKIESFIAENPLRFQCQGSGQCCLSRGQYGFVYLTREDRARLAKHLGISTRAFTTKFCEKTKHFWHLKERSKPDPKSPDCLFLKNKTRCGVYEARPTQCRTWPFWPEVMDAKSWKQEVVAFCPGAGKGAVVDPESILKQVKEQVSSERALDREARQAMKR